MLPKIKKKKKKKEKDRAWKIQPAQSIVVKAII